MVIRAQIGNSPHMGIFVLGLGSFFDLFVFFSEVVDALLILFPVGIDHRSSVTAARVALPLHVSLLLAVAAHDIWVAQAVAARRGGGATLGRVGVAERLLTADSSNLVDFVIGQFVPEDGVGLLRVHSGFNSRNLLRAFAVILNGLDFPGKLHALLEGGLAGFQDLVTDGVLDACQE
jgi:hypothetical protein